MIRARQYWAHISGRQTPGLTQGLPPPPNLLYKKRGEPRVEPGVGRPEMWALVTNLQRCVQLDLQGFSTQQFNTTTILLYFFFIIAVPKLAK
jgi:hypothetical protein